MTGTNNWNQNRHFPPKFQHFLIKQQRLKPFFCWQRTSWLEHSSNKFT